jgi:hypothetical protein
MKRYLFFLILLASCSTPEHTHDSCCCHHHNSIIIGFAGDAMLGRSVDEKLQSPGFNPWGSLLPELKKSDFNIVNLETTLTDETKATPKVFNFKSSPKNVTALQHGAINIVNLANNHSLDFGFAGLAETIKTLNRAGIKHVGAGQNKDQAQKPLLLQKKGVRIGVLGYTDNEPGWLATAERPGTNYIHVGDIDRIKTDVAKIRDKVDLVIVTIHWGPNMKNTPSPEVINFAHQMIDAGVDIIHGHSAHVVQAIELYNDGVIMYDTGDLIDDYAIDPVMKNNHSLFIQICVDAHKEMELTAIPLIIENMQVNKAENNVAQKIIRNVNKLCEPFGTKITNDGTIVKNNKPISKNSPFCLIKPSTHNAARFFCIRRGSFCICAAN